MTNLILSASFADEPWRLSERLSRVDRRRSSGEANELAIGGGDSTHKTAPVSSRRFILLLINLDLAFNIATERRREREGDESNALICSFDGTFQLLSGDSEPPGILRPPRPLDWSTLYLIRLNDELELSRHVQSSSERFEGCLTRSEPSSRTFSRTRLVHTQQLLCIRRSSRRLREGWPLSIRWSHVAIV